MIGYSPPQVDGFGYIIIRSPYIPYSTYLRGTVCARLILLCTLAKWMVNARFQGGKLVSTVGRFRLRLRARWEVDLPQPDPWMNVNTFDNVSFRLVPLFGAAVNSEKHIPCFISQFLCHYFSAQYHLSNLNFAD